MAKRPKKKSQRAPAPARDASAGADNRTPRFCLRHLHSDYSVSKLPMKHRSNFATALEKRAAMTWRELKMSDRHAVGFELIPASKIRSKPPEPFRDHERFVAFRYYGKRPMVGVRTGDTFHVIWIEAEFGDLYDHGS